MQDYAAARRHMVDSQIRPNKVTDERIMEAMGKVPREIFVPPSLKGVAYVDEDIQIAPGRFLMEPQVAVESDPQLAEIANKTMAALEITNVAVVEGGLDKDYSRQGPFNVVFVNGAVEERPDSWTKALAEGGRLVCVETTGGVGKAILYTKVAGVP